MFDYLFRVGVALDQLCNVVFCNGAPDETMSSYAYRMHLKGGHWGFLKGVIDFLALPFESDHCQKAYQSELSRAHLPSTMRQRATIS